MSLIVPWTDPGAASCCCCNEAQGPTYSAVQISPAAYAALQSGGTVTYDFGVSLNYGGTGSFGASATQTGNYAIRAVANLAGGCASSATPNPPAISLTQNTIGCGYVSPSSDLVWSVNSTSCFVTLGALGVFAYALGAQAYIQAAGTILGGVSRSWNGTDPSTGTLVATTLAQASFTWEFITAATHPVFGATAGTGSLIIGGETFDLPVSYKQVLVGSGTVEWIGPTITVTPSAP